MENENTGAGNGLKRVGPWLVRLGKYKYALVVLLLGALLMLLPVRKETASAQTASAEAESGQQDPEQLQKELAALLSRVDGAGRTDVILSLDYGSEYFYQSDEAQDTGADTVRTESKTVFSQADGAQRPVVRTTRCPVYRGAIVVCEGADSPRVELAIVQAVSRLTGLGSDKISVMKMKQ